MIKNNNKKKNTLVYGFKSFKNSKKLKDILKHKNLYLLLLSLNLLRRWKMVVSKRLAMK